MFQAIFAQGTLVDVLVGNPDFSTLVTVVKAADLVGTLSGGNYSRKTSLHCQSMFGQSSI